MICLFEDRYADGFYPLTATRHVADLLHGSMTTRERLTLLANGDEIFLHSREYLRPLYKEHQLPEHSSEPVLFLNARLRLESDSLEQLPEGTGWIIRSGDDVLAARLSPEEVARLNLNDGVLDFSLVDGLVDAKYEGGKLYRYLWEMIEENNQQIIADSQRGEWRQVDKLPDGVAKVGNEPVLMGGEVSLAPGVVLDTTSGPILLADGVTVMANSVIQGPCSVGAHSTIKIAAKIYHGTSIGPWCKVGGEVENSIILGYSNKQHDGFLGHSYLGAWVNLGADTNTSDLKNNYGEIRVTLRGEEIDTGQMFLGSLIGDHSKTGINTMLNTGTVIGPFANIFGGGFPPKEIPPYSWCDVQEIVPYRLDKGLELAARVMKRRNVELTEEERGVLVYLYEREHGRGGE